MRSKWNGEPPYREIDFGFVFVRAVRAGEAKLRVRARGKSPVAEARPDQMLADPAFGGARCPAGVPPVSRRCPDDDDDDDDGDDDDDAADDDDGGGDDDDGDGDGDGDDDDDDDDDYDDDDDDDDDDDGA